MSLLVFALLLALQIPAKSNFSPFKIKLNYSAFSPNDDGSQDYLLIKTTNLAKGLKSPLNWECEIRNSKDERVIKWQADKRLRRSEPSIANLFLPKDKNIKPISMFKELFWDGRNKDGRIVADGSYSIKIRIVDRYTSRIHSQVVNSIIVDTKEPKIQLKPLVSSIVPISTIGLRGQEFVLQQESRNAGIGAEYTAQLFKYTGGLIFEKKWKNNLPARSRVSWEVLGTKSKSIFGRYRYRLIAKDKAGNTAFVDYSDLIIARSVHDVILKSDKLGFSPNKDGVNDSILLTIASINSKGITTNSGRRIKWKLQILNDKLDSVVYQKSGSGQLRQKIYWNGKNKKNILSDGLYYARVYIQGRIAAELLPIIIDTSPPKISINLFSQNFTPDGDGRNDLLKYKVNFDAEEIINWKVATYLTARNKSGRDSFNSLRKLYKLSYANLKPGLFFWDGKSDNGLLAESYENYQIILEVQDQFGNRAIESIKNIRTGLLLRPTKAGERKLIARIPLQGYFTNKEKLTSKGRKLLNQIHSDLGSYGLYKYQIETHSSSKGREEKNLLITEQQSHSIHQYIMKTKWPSKKIKTRGYGETELRNEKKSTFINYRNARIELRLVF